MHFNAQLVCKFNILYYFLQLFHRLFYINLEIKLTKAQICHF